MPGLLCLRLATSCCGKRLRIDSHLPRRLQRKYQFKSPPLLPISRTQFNSWIRRTDMDSSSSNHPHGHLHFVMIPLMAQGHTLPMLDTARLLAARPGVVVTLVTTTHSASRLRPAVDRATQSGLPIRLAHIPFPAREAGLPDGCETIAAITTADMFKNYFAAILLLQHPVENLLLTQTQPRPSCIIADSSFVWANDTARKLRVPRLAFQGFCCFAWACLHTIRLQQQLVDRIASDSEPFVLPGLPHRIELTKAQVPSAFSHSPDADKMRNMVKDAELAADGMVFNSFEELEPEHYAKCYEEATGKKAWLLGPVCLVNRNASDKADRGNEAAIKERQCLDWLDSRPPKSVVYVSFGSLCKFTAAQLMEIGLGLEASKKAFIWVVRKNEDSSSSEMEKWLQGADGFEERVKGRGLVIRGWAPQILILSHPATAGFVTHCGWNSTLEGICAGLPMISWPLSAEQFLNEKLVGPEVLGIAFSMGVKAGSRSWDEVVGDETVKREEVEKAIERLMDGGEEGEERRRRAHELGLKARKAVEVGGSSYTNMTNLIHHITMNQAHQGN